jgi:uncharacterized YigZ family protein
MAESRYLIPAEIHQTEIVVVNSRFITTIGPVPTVDAARIFLKYVREEMPDASHHVYAFQVGHGNSIIEGMSDDGEPTGTAGPPVLAVLRGSQIGDIIVVVTRYFGGTKLGTGGLVRAYSEAARTALTTLKTEEKIEKRLLGIESPYSLYELVKRLIEKHTGEISDETFAGEVTILASFPVSAIERFTLELRDLSAGRITPIIFDDV